MASETHHVGSRGSLLHLRSQTYMISETEAGNAQELSQGWRRRLEESVGWMQGRCEGQGWEPCKSGVHTFTSRVHAIPLHNPHGIHADVAEQTRSWGPLATENNAFVFGHVAFIAMRPNAYISRQKLASYNQGSPKKRKWRNKILSLPADPQSLAQKWWDLKICWWKI